MATPHAAALVLLVCAAKVCAGCRWQASVSASGSLTPDTFVIVEVGDNPDVYVIQGKVADFGACPPDLEEPISGPLQLSSYPHYLDGEETLISGEGLYPSDGCEDVSEAEGAVLWSVRGGCNFVNKTYSAQKAKAVALLVSNSGERMASEVELTTMGCPRNTEQLCDESLLTTVFISAKDGRQLSFWHQQGLTMTVSISRVPLLDVQGQWVALWLTASLLTITAALIPPVLEQRIASGAPPIPGWQPALDLSIVHAGGFVVASGVMMMMCLFFVRDFLMVFVSIYCLVGAISLACVASFALRALSPRFSYEVTPPLWEPTSIATVMLLPPCIVLASFWFLFRHLALSWLIQDALSAALALHLLLSVRFRDLRVTALLVVLAVVYDLGWVMVGPVVFSHAPVSMMSDGSPPPEPETFMDKVLQVHPADTVPLIFLLPSEFNGETETRPPVVVLGIGNVVIPALVLGLARRADYKRKGEGRRVGCYFWVSAFSFSAALALTCSVASETAETARGPFPFLLILSFATLGPFLGIAWQRGEYDDLWEGPVDAP
eukprot:CAMPEP_0181292444 /NCGR_PEP_ID=MMETSP1101-20121128/2510_1 /TAXON_ID=46948 /ORGANISM="Rhodomonas abbreviata, Strain Caron Lab Isolate" /LENGTH=548 /DNA_ID=CAMNT_0023396915 /DNA_START=31 /DNA_END=1673 /DNA_ORIENTATION=-